MSKRVREVHTPWGRCSIDDYSQQYLALLLPGSRPNAIGTLQVLVHIVTVNRWNIFVDRTKPQKFINTKIFYMNYF